MSAVDDVRSLSNTEVVQVAEALFDTIYAEVSHDAVIEYSSDAPEVSSLVTLAPETLQRELSADDSAALARNMLLAYAEDPNLAPVVQRTIAEVRDSDDLVVGVLLTLGLIVNLTLLVVSTSIEIEKDKRGKVTWKIKKRNIKPDTIRAVVEPLAKVAKVAKVAGT
jgi:hypothetical protein